MLWKWTALFFSQLNVLFQTMDCRVLEFVLCNFFLLFNSDQISLIIVRVRRFLSTGDLASGSKGTLFIWLILNRGNEGACKRRKKQQWNAKSNIPLYPPGHPHLLLAVWEYLHYLWELCAVPKLFGFFFFILRRQKHRHTQTRTHTQSETECSPSAGSFLQCL